MMKNQQGGVFIVAGILIPVIIISSAAYFLSSQNNKQIPVLQVPEKAPEEVSRQNSVDQIAVKIENGDIIVTKDGENKKITEWGFNSSPTLSPDKTKIAYISKTEESLKNEKIYQGYVPTSTNVWIINTDGTNPIKVTNHKNWVHRDNLTWLDADQLLFTDGESSAKLYSLSKKLLKNVLGDEEPEGMCVDACGGYSQFFLSPDKRYLLRLGSDSNGGIAVIPSSAILNTKTLQTLDINQKFTAIFDNTVSFNNNSVSFQGSTDDLGTPLMFNINLETGETTHL